MVKDGFWNHHEYKAWALLGYSFDLVNEVHTHVVLLFLLKTMWARGVFYLEKLLFVHRVMCCHIYNNITKN